MRLTMRLFNYKFRFYKMGIIAFMLTLMACSDDFLEKVPTGIVSPETVFATTENAYAAINGMHRNLYRQWYSRQSEGGQSGNMIYMEALGEDLVMTDQSNGWFISEYRWQQHRNVESNLVRFNYGFYYAFIGNSNMILANIDEAEGPDEDRDFIKAQALTYRAWSYFQMIQLYADRYVKGGDNSGLGLSLILEPTEGAVPRNTVEEVYQQINKDLDDAISLFGSAVDRPDRFDVSECV